jgi:alcohol dehydrogenase
MVTNAKIFSYRCPTEIYLGVNSREKLGDITSEWKVKRLLFLSDEGVASTEMFKSVESILKGNRVALDIFTDIEPDPSDKTVEKAYGLYRKSQPSVILALGGGSTIDVGKAVGILATNGGRIHDYEGIDTYSNPPLPLIAIPTTAGTGSEVSGSCVITDTDRGVKMSIRSAAMNPAKVAILDPVSLMSLPARVAAYAAVDAFVHALESYVSLHANPVTDAMNLHAIELIARNIRPFTSNRANLDAGLQMLCAASLAAMGFSNTGVGNIHCMARFVGALFHVPHGLSTAVCLPYGAEFNLMATPEKFARVAMAMGETANGLTTLEAAKKAIEAIKQLVRDIGITEKLRDIGVTEDMIPEMARLAFEANYNRWNPRYTTYEDFLALFEKAY